MQSLEQINKQNSDKFTEAISENRSSGKHVVLEKQGLHAVGFKSFTSLHQAEGYKEIYEKELGCSAKVLPSTLAA